MEIGRPSVENVTLGLRPRATFSTSGSSYFHVPLTTVRHLLNAAREGAGNGHRLTCTQILCSSDVQLQRHAHRETHKHTNAHTDIHHYHKTPLPYWGWNKWKAFWQLAQYLQMIWLVIQSQNEYKANIQHGPTKKYLMASSVSVSYPGQMRACRCRTYWARGWDRYTAS